jgi:hypothetical protein
MSEEEQIQYVEQSPQPQFGMPTPPSLELVEYLTKNQRYIVDPRRDKKDPERVVDGDHPGEYDDAFWSVWSKDFILSNLTEKEIYIILEKLKENECLLQISRSDQKTTIKSLMNDNNQEVMGIVKLSRGKDGFERNKIISSIQQSLVGQINAQPQQRQGLSSKLMNPMTWFGRPQ